MPLRKLQPAKPFVLHTFERAFVTVLFGYFLLGMLSAFFATHSIIPLLTIVSEILPVLLVYTRGSSATLSANLTDWVLAFAGTSAPLLTSTSAVIIPSPRMMAIILGLIIIGMCVQIAAKVVLWRSFGIVAANRGVKIEGPYRFVRHPMYAGYEIERVGYFLAFPSWYNALLYLSAFAIQVARVLREERVLGRDPAYQTFASRVRYRLLPGVF